VSVKRGFTVGVSKSNGQPLTCVEMVEGVRRQHETAQVRKPLFFVAGVVKVCSFVTVLCVWALKGCCE
jgi:hypothetical protein